MKSLSNSNKPSNLNSMLLFDSTTRGLPTAFSQFHLLKALQRRKLSQQLTTLELVFRSLCTLRLIPSNHTETLTTEETWRMELPSVQALSTGQQTIPKTVYVNGKPVSTLSHPPNFLQLLLSNLSNNLQTSVHQDPEAIMNLFPQ